MDVLRPCHIKKSYKMQPNLLIEDIFPRASFRQPAVISSGTDFYCRNDIRQATAATSALCTTLLLDK
jgi:hypothetical protein